MVMALSLLFLDSFLKTLKLISLSVWVVYKSANNPVQVPDLGLQIATMHV